jgi:hypothetical protein
MVTEAVETHNLHKFALRAGCEMYKKGRHLSSIEVYSKSTHTPADGASRD